MVAGRCHDLAEPDWARRRLPLSSPRPLLHLAETAERTRVAEAPFFIVMMRRGVPRWAARGRSRGLGAQGIGRRRAARMVAFAIRGMKRVGDRRAATPDVGTGRRVPADVQLSRWMVSCAVCPVSQRQADGRRVPQWTRTGSRRGGGDAAGFRALGVRPVSARGVEKGALRSGIVSGCQPRRRQTAFRSCVRGC